jgi:2'-hydroxyisoflavone reductase
VHVLILGGGHFLGRAIAEMAVIRGWNVSTFNRGRSSTKIKGVAHVLGDRTRARDVEALSKAGSWDAVVDTSAQEPAHVRRSAMALRTSAGLYVLVSSLTAYAEWPAGGLTEDSPVRAGRADLTATSPEIVSLPASARFGTLKAGCEVAATESFGHSSLVVRPGLIVGPHERKGRLPWWLRRVHRGGSVLVPGEPGRRIQMLDVRDLAVFLLDLVAAGATGPINATGEPVTWAEFLAACGRTTGASPPPVWVDDGWLESMGVRPLRDVPLWQACAGMWDVRSERARASGLTVRPMPDTLADTWAWIRRESPQQPRFGLGPAEERHLLASWLSTSTSPGR